MDAVAKVKLMACANANRNALLKSIASHT